MSDWLLKISFWSWNNISKIDSIVNIIAVILRGGAFIGGVACGLIASILRLKLKRSEERRVGKE